MVCRTPGQRVLENEGDYSARKDSSVLLPARPSRISLQGASGLVEGRTVAHTRQLLSIPEAARKRAGDLTPGNLHALTSRHQAGSAHAVRIRNLPLSFAFSRALTFVQNFVSFLSLPAASPRTVQPEIIAPRSLKRGHFSVLASNPFRYSGRLVALDLFFVYAGFA